MGWFEHRHRWYPHSQAAFNKVMAGLTGDLVQDVLILEHCNCGAVRTIQFKPGEAPIVRMAKVEEASQ